MPRRYVYTVTCTKETPARWGIEFEAVDRMVPARIVRFPYLMHPLGQSSYFYSGYDPMAYFKQLIKGIPAMLRGYNERILSRIQKRLDGVEVGECDYIKVTYVDDGASDPSPFSYKIEIIDPSPASDAEGQNQPEPTTGRGGVGNRGSESNGRDEDLAAVVNQLHSEIKQLRADVNRLKAYMIEG